MDGSIQLFLGVKILGFVLIVTIGKSSNMLICPLKHLPLIYSTLKHSKASFNTVFHQRLGSLGGGFEPKLPKPSSHVFVPCT